MKNYISKRELIKNDLPTAGNFYNCFGDLPVKTQLNLKETIKKMEKIIF